MTKDEDRQVREIHELLQPRTWEEIAETEALCPACGDWMDFCSGHGEMGDPLGHAILQDHDNGDHSRCFGGNHEMSKKYCDE